MNDIAKNTAERVGSLWIGSKLSWIERVSLASFVAEGHPVTLYAYEDVGAVPTGVELADGREIISQDMTFTYRDGPGKGSYAGFADVFRYDYLLQKGGWWVDTDLVCLRRLPEQPKIAFGLERDQRITNSAIKVPAFHALSCALAAQATAIGDTAAWGEAGPDLLTKIAEDFDLRSAALPMSSFYPVRWQEWRWPFEGRAHAVVSGLIETSYALHLSQEMMRREGFAKDGPFDPDCWFVAKARELGFDPPVTSPRRTDSSFSIYRHQGALTDHWLRTAKLLLFVGGDRNLVQRLLGLFVRHPELSGQAETGPLRFPPRTLAAAVPALDVRWSAAVDGTAMVDAFLGDGHSRAMRLVELLHASPGSRVFVIDDGSDELHFLKQHLVGALSHQQLVMHQEIVASAVPSVADGLRNFFWLREDEGWQKQIWTS